MAFLSRDSRAGVPKSRPAGLPRLWSPITLRADLGSKCSLKQSCNSRRELSNGMSHVICSQVFRVDSRLLVVGSQNRQTPGSSTLGLSFGHNLCFRCPNEQCELILDIYASRAFHSYKERHKPLRFDPSNRSVKFWESIGTPSLKVRVALGVWGFTPSHFPTLPGIPDVTPRLPFGPHPCNPFALVASPKLGLRQQVYSRLNWKSCSRKKKPPNDQNPSFKKKEKKGEGRFKAWWPMEGERKTPFCFFSHSLNKFYLNFQFFSFDLEVLFYHGPRPLFTHFLPFFDL
jgi:hypothetical protein